MPTWWQYLTGGGSSASSDSAEAYSSSGLPQHRPDERKRNRHRTGSDPEPSLPNPFTPYSSLTASEEPCSEHADSQHHAHADGSPPSPSRSRSRSPSPGSSSSGSRPLRRTLPHLVYRPASTLITIDEVDSGLSSAGGSATPGTSTFGSVPGTITLPPGLSQVQADGEYFKPHGPRRRSSLGHEAEVRSVSDGEGEGGEQGARSGSTSGSGSGSGHLRADADGSTSDEDGDDDERHRRSAAPSAASHSSPAMLATERSPLCSPNRSSRSIRSVQSGLSESSKEPAGPPLKWSERPLVVAGFKLGLLFLLFTAVLGGTLWFGVPRLDKADREKIKLPRSFADLQTLNGLFQKYKELYPFKILACGIVTYLFVQAFSLPGSMYISILFGAAYGIIYGLLLSCVCEASGALLCYTLSAIVGPPLLTIPSYRDRLETWRIKIMGDASKGEQVGWDGVFAFLVVLRIAPFPPHWIANVVAPHLGISPLLFWLACFVGIGPVSVIHVTIGSGLDSMTSADDFHLLSAKNILGLVGVGVAVLIPVGLKRVFKKDLSGLSDAEAALANPDAAKATSEVGSTSGISRASDDSLDPYFASEPYSYQAQDSGLVLSPAHDYAGEDNDSGFSRRDKGKARDAFDLEQALDVIRNDEDEEVLAVVYDGDMDEEEHAKFEGLYGKIEDGSDEEASIEGYGRGRYAPSVTSRTRGYGAIEHGAEEERQVEQRSWWRFWK